MAKYSQPSPSAQASARAQAHWLTQELANHRRTVSAMVSVRPGMCMADGWNVGFDELNGDFDLDAPLLERLLAQAGPAGPSMRATPEPVRSPTAPGAGSALKDYVFAPPSTAPVGSLPRLGDETGGAVYGPGNVLANSSAALAGALQGFGERDAAKPPKPVASLQGVRSTPTSSWWLRLAVRVAMLWVLALAWS